MENSKRVVIVKEFMGKYNINEFYRPIAQALCKKFPEIKSVPINSLLFLDNTEGTGKSLDKIKYAQAGKVPGKWAEVIYQLTGNWYTNYIEFFKRNTEGMTREQIVALVYHELRHIMHDGNLQHHDVEDWSEMHRFFGRNWASTKAIIPDLLDDDIDWDVLESGQQRLNFGDTGGLKVVR